MGPCCHVIRRGTCPTPHGARAFAQPYQGDMNNFKDVCIVSVPERLLGENDVSSAAEYIRLHGRPKGLNKLPASTFYTIQDFSVG